MSQIILKEPYGTSNYLFIAVTLGVVRKANITANKGWKEHTEFIANLLVSSETRIQLKEELPFDLNETKFLAGFVDMYCRALITSDNSGALSWVFPEYDGVFASPDVFMTFYLKTADELFDSLKDFYADEPEFLKAILSGTKWV